MNSNRCARCNQSIFAADKQERYEGNVYHSGCFTCSNPDCQIRLTTQNARGFNKMPFCRSHVPNEGLNRRITFIDHTYVNVRSSLSTDELNEENGLNCDYDEINPLVNSEQSNEMIHPIELKKEIRTIIKRSGNDMVDDVFSNLSRNFHIVICGSPRVGKSTLINVICGKEVAKAKEGMASVTQKIECYTREGQCHTGSNSIHYKYHFWDTPGFESWGKDDIKAKVKEILDKPDSKPLCMIFCASPGSFVDLDQLECLLNKCIRKRHIYCALVCTNKYAGTKKSRQAVLDEFNRLLSKFVDEPPRIENGITFYGNVGLCGAVNSVTFEDDDRRFEVEGINELIYGIMESLVDEQVLNWCFLVLENQGFWNDCHQKVSGLIQKAKQTKHLLENILFTKKNKKDNFKSFLSK